MYEATDYYHLLEIDDSASAETIKQAYRKLALAYHPDRNPGDVAAEERFKGVQCAYEVLADPVRRAAYDQARQKAFVRSSLFGAFENATRDPLSSGFGGAAGSPVPPADAADDPIFGFFFDQGRPPPRGADVETQLQLTFDQALRGGVTDLPVHEAEAVRLIIPRGVRTGVRIRVPGRGRHAEGGQPGDLFVTLRVDASPRFRREGDHLHIGETVSAIEAILGTSRSITNAYGQTIKVTIPAGTQPGERLRLRGQGVVTDKRVGDLFVEVLMTVPRELSDAQRAELERAAQAAGLL